MKTARIQQNVAAGIGIGADDDGSLFIPERKGHTAYNTAKLIDDDPQRLSLRSAVVVIVVAAFDQDFV